MTRRHKWGASAGIFALIMAVLALYTWATGVTSQSSAPSALPASEVASALDQISKQPAATLPPMRLAKKLTPPTNKWFSGLVFGDHPQPVFPLPLSFGLTDQGFTFGVPPVNTTPDTIDAPASTAISVNAHADHQIVSAYDESSVTIEQRDRSGRPIGTVLIAEGSPLVTFTAATPTVLALAETYTPASANLWRTTVDTSEYGLSTTGRKSGNSLTLSTGQTAVWVAVPRNLSLKSISSYLSPLAATSLTYSTDPRFVSTTIGYRTVNNSETLIVAMPHQQQTPLAALKCTAGSYPSVYGTLALCTGSSLRWNSLTIRPNSTLDVASLSPAQKSQLQTQISRDTEAHVELPADTYFGGKALYRLANLLQLAKQLDVPTAASRLQTQLTDALQTWTDPKGCSSRSTRCFVYDAKAKGIIGLAASFGSDQFNDHHFHYGYFFYAASVAVQHDAKLAAKLSPVLTLLAADLASGPNNGAFPQRRVFDAYAGHSWASGFAPFAAGNNQESSSEAVAAWNGLALWAQATANVPLEQEAVWMMSAEAASANAYWTNFDIIDPVYRDYHPSIVSLNWGSKRDYATWFSADPAAKLAILALPMAPISGYLGSDPHRVTENLAPATANGYNQSYGDYLLMYSALAGKQQAAAALSQAENLPDQFIDPGNSRSYLLAWIMTR